MTLADLLLKYIGVKSVNTRDGDVVLTRADVGLDRVANASPSDLVASQPFTQALAQQAPLVHTHQIVDVQGLQQALDTLTKAVSDLRALVVPRQFKPVSARLMGMNIGAKNYDNVEYQAQMSKCGLLVLGFYKGWKGDVSGSTIRPVLQRIKAMNPGIKLFQYTILNESTVATTNDANADVALKLNQENWWLRNAAGQMQQWTTTYNAWDVNITSWMTRDAQGLLFSQWKAQRDNQLFFSVMPEFDGWYFDNLMSYSRVVSANWKLDGQDISSRDPVVASAYRNGHALELATAKGLQPNLLMMANVSGDLSEPEYKGKYGLAFLEAVMGKSWSRENTAGWLAAYNTYRLVEKNLGQPGIACFNVQTALDDHRTMLYGLATCLLGNGYFSFTDQAVGYSSVPWFPEYDLPLGEPDEDPPTSARDDGAWERRYENGTVLVNPSKTDTLSVNIGGSYQSSVVTLAPRSGAIVMRA